MGIHTVRGYRAMKATARIDWRQKYDAETLPYGPLAADNGRERAPDFIAWDDVHHLVIIPTYKESVEKLRATLGKLAESEVAREKLLVVIAMEEPDTDAPRRFEILQREFGHSFLAMIGTTHPGDIAGEVRGKSSNEAWAAKKAKRLFCDEMGFDLDHMTVTSCDADTLFHPRYFSALTYYFATNPKRYRTFWQGPDLLLQQRLGRAGAAAHPEQPRRHQPPRQADAEVHRAVPAVHVQPQHAHVPRRRLLGRRRRAGRLAHVPQVLLRARRRAGRAADPAARRQRRRARASRTSARSGSTTSRRAATPGAAPTSPTPSSSSSRTRRSRSCAGCAARGASPRTTCSGRRSGS